MIYLKSSLNKYYIFKLTARTVQLYRRKGLVNITMINPSICRVMMVFTVHRPSQSYQSRKRELTESRTGVRNDPANISTGLPRSLFPVHWISPLTPLSPPDTRLALARSDSRLYIVFLTREYSVPGIIMKQEKTVCWERVRAS